jgi:23S rRNA (uridine2552-2'-O)-methyltransferase
VIDGIVIIGFTHKDGFVSVGKDKKDKKQKHADGRGLKVRVHTAHRRSVSSTLWLERQLNDPYVAKARREGLRSRAAYKLLELDQRFRILKAGMTVVDLGAAPGGWTQVAARKVRSDVGGDTSNAARGPGGTEGSRSYGKVVALDILPMDAIEGAEVLHLDFLDTGAPATLRKAIGANTRDGGVDVVLSDMAPPATGQRETDHIRIMNLVEAAVEFAAEVLKPGGAFIAKTWQGGTEAALLAQLKRDYSSVKHAKPPASRPESAEVYVVATGFRGGNKPDSKPAAKTGVKTASR